MNLASWEAVWAANSARRAANSARRVSDSALETMCPFCTQICVPAGNWSNRGPVSLSPPLLPAPSPFTLVDAPFFSPLERYWPSLFPLLNSFLSEYIIIKKYLCTMCANNSDSTLNKLCLWYWLKCDFIRYKHNVQTVFLVSAKIRRKGLCQTCCQFRFFCDFAGTRYLLLGRGNHLKNLQVEVCMQVEINTPRKLFR